jgi:hypothetical protein
VGKVMVIVFSDKVQMVDQPQRSLQPRVQQRAAKQGRVDLLEPA